MQEHVFQKPALQNKELNISISPPNNKQTANNNKKTAIHHHHNKTHHDAPELQQNGFPLWFCNVAGLAKLHSRNGFERESGTRWNESILELFVFH